MGVMKDLHQLVDLAPCKGDALRNGASVSGSVLKYSLFEEFIA